MLHVCTTSTRRVRASRVCLPSPLFNTIFCIYVPKKNAEVVCDALLWLGLLSFSLKKTIKASRHSLFVAGVPAQEYKAAMEKQARLQKQRAEERAEREREDAQIARELAEKLLAEERAAAAADAAAAAAAAGASASVPTPEAVAQQASLMVRRTPLLMRVCAFFFVRPVCIEHRSAPGRFGRSSTITPTARGVPVPTDKGVALERSGENGPKTRRSCRRHR